MIDKQTNYGESWQINNLSSWIAIAEHLTYVSRLNTQCVGILCCKVITLLQLCSSPLCSFKCWMAQALSGRHYVMTIVRQRLYTTLFNNPTWEYLKTANLAVEQRPGHCLAPVNILLRVKLLINNSLTINLTFMLITIITAKVVLGSPELLVIQQLNATLLISRIKTLYTNIAQLWIQTIISTHIYLILP